MIITSNNLGYTAEYEGHIVMASSISDCINLIADEIQLELDLL